MSGRTPVPNLTRFSRFQTISASTTSAYGSFASPASEDIGGLYVGSAGTVVAVGSDGVSATFQNVPAGTVLPISPKQVTSGGALLALYW